MVQGGREEGIAECTDVGTSDLYIGKQWCTRDKVGGSKLQLYRLTSRMKSYAEHPLTPDLPTGSAGIKTPPTRAVGPLLAGADRNGTPVTSDEAATGWHDNNAPDNFPESRVVHAR